MSETKDYSIFIKNLCSKVTPLAQKNFDKKAKVGIQLINKWNKPYGFKLKEPASTYSNWDIILEREGEKYIVEIKVSRLTYNRAIELYGKEGQMIEKDKMDRVIKDSKDYNAKPYYFVFFQDGTLLTADLSYGAQFKLIPKSCPKTTAVLSDNIIKQTLMIPFSLMKKNIL